VTPWLQIQLKLIKLRHEIPPPVLEAQEEEVAMEQRNKEVEAHKKITLKLIFQLLL
jgi:hypothetical protein